MATWLATLPEPKLSTLREQAPNNVIRTSMDVGPSKVRRRTTASVRNLSFILMLTPEQVSDLDEFYVTTVTGGSTKFNYTHPRTGEAVEARFVEAPAYSEQEGAIYSVSISLEILP